MVEENSRVSQLAVCNVIDLKPGLFVVKDMERLRLAVTLLDGEYFAFDDICPHRQGYLSEGPVEDGKLVCPLHAWRFDIRTGAMSGNPGVTIRTFQVSVFEGKIWVDLDPRILSAE